MIIDWDEFIKRVPSGTRVRYDMSPIEPFESLHVEGVLIERDYTVLRSDCTAHKIHYPSGRTSSETYDYPAELMEYFINDQWLTFEQVMSNAY